MFSVDDMTKAGCTTRRGVRHWEELDLLGEVERSGGGHRRYTPEQLDRARIIAAAQFGGWKLDEIKEMIEHYDEEAREALLYRLESQAAAARTLADNLPAASEGWDL